MMSFPAITICNLNPFRFSQITKNDLYHMGHAFEMLKRDKTLAHSTYIDPEHLRVLRQLSDFNNDFTPTKSFSMKEFYDRAGIQIDEMLLKGSYELQYEGVLRPSRSFSMKEFYDRAGIQIDEMLLKCSYRGDDNCGPNNFTTLN
ncbi:acid-sensing ion channel 1C-like [Branchiostoma floridae]|uniref:Acid-sensing ion channel 1C-like n=1 Tax=Branchiostoma floridae TaxID=7739 RepID=A0A9J7HTQ7_BRAFL|nr:acid-sensing ion channel 1C-like [Branchiostoma floridae]